MASNESHGINVTQVCADILCEFLEVAFHLILYIRELYPPGIFERRKKYNVPVQMSCHPEVNQYITNVLQSVKPLIVKDELHRVVLAVLNSSHQPVERFVFEIAPVIARSLSNDNYLLRLEQSLRAFLLKLNVCDAVLEEIPSDCSFIILVYTKESSVLEIEQTQFIQNFPWIEADKSNYTMNDVKMVPLKAVSSDLIKMQLYAEESKQKIS
ncbi:MAD2B-like protein [Saccoglossus kowalevskii]|uniref:Mitotic spindle assembly checkpoint protein MAD2B n=1 Tax=Saccoglossus kowalevskii TaxID=10224 RepID=D1LX60_SACKO|nr:MAD2B-like protein [Saccoglossus kowalevskii]ACY92566.1 MAD2B-like protein [Saccoglossus kowalevskii]